MGDSSRATLRRIKHSFRLDVFQEISPREIAGKGPDNQRDDWNLEGAGAGIVDVDGAEDDRCGNGPCGKDEEVGHDVLLSQRTETERLIDHVARKNLEEIRRCAARTPTVQAPPGDARRLTAWVRGGMR